MERRYLNGEREIRMEEGEGGGRRIVHHAPPWGMLSEVLWIDHHEGRELPVREIFERGAFAAVLGDPDGMDVVGLMNHDRNRVLGRTPGTLRLEEDNVGLRYEILLPKTASGREVEELVGRGDLRGSSFSFRAGEFSFQLADEEGKPISRVEKAGMIVRTVKSVLALYDVGPVTFPAYRHGRLGLRGRASCEAVVEGLGAWKKASANAGRRRQRGREAVILRMLR